MSARDLLLRLEIPVNQPLKLNDKQEFLQSVINQFKAGGVTEVKLQDSYYADHKAAEIPPALVIILQITASVSTIIASSFAIMRMMKTASVSVKRKDGSYVKVKDGMTDDDVLKLLGMNDDSEKQS